MFNRVLSFLTAAILAAAVIACGGSSSSSGGAMIGPQLPPASELPITPDNAVEVTADVVSSISSLFDLLELTNVAELPFPDLSVARGKLGVSSDLPFAKFAVAHFEVQNIVMPRSVVVNTTNCDSGNFSNTWDDADNDLEISTGDAMDIVFASCLFTDLGVTLGGAASISNISISGDPQIGRPPWSVAANFDFVDLVGTDSSGIVTINGDFDISASSADGLTATLALSGSELTAVDDSGSDTLSNFVITEQFDLVAQMITVDATGTLTSEQLNGFVNFATTESLVIFGSDENPSSGEILITHATSSLTATILDNISVQLAIDADGDGTAETTLVVGWAELDVS